MNDQQPTLTVEMTEAELDQLLKRVDKWNLHVRNMVLDLADRARLQIITGEKSPEEAYTNLREQVGYQYGHNREILQSMISLAMRGGKVRAFANGGGEGRNQDGVGPNQV